MCARMRMLLLLQQGLPFVVHELIRCKYGTRFWPVKVRQIDAMKRKKAVVSSHEKQCPVSPLHL